MRENDRDLDYVEVVETPEIIVQVEWQEQQSEHNYELWNQKFDGERKEIEIYLQRVERLREKTCLIWLLVEFLT